MMCHFNQYSSLFRLLVFALFFLVVEVDCKAQTTAMNAYGMEQGLIQNQVESIIQDNDGNLWIGTIAGLSKYDGFQFTSFTKNQGLAEDWITATHKDKSGNLFFGHWGGSITRYNFRLKIFENLDLAELTHYKPIRAIKEDNKGQIWIATEGTGVLLLNSSLQDVIFLQKKHGFPSDNVYDLIFDSRGMPIFVTDSGLAYCNSIDMNTVQHSVSKYNQSDGLISDRLISICKIDNQEIWLGSADKGLGVYSLEYDKIKKKLRIYPRHKINTSNGLSSDFIKTIVTDSKHRVWLGTAGGGAVCVNREMDNRKNKFKLFTYNTRQGLNYFSVNTLFEDREHSMWIGTDLGLNQFRGERFQLFDEADSIPNNIIWSIHSDEKNRIWLGTNKGLSQLNLEYDAKGHVINKTHNAITQIPKIAISAIYLDSRNNLWAGTSFEGIYRLNLSTNEIQHLNQANGLASDVVYDVTEDKTGTIWIGTKEGASRYNHETNKIKNMNAEDGLGGNAVFRLFNDRKGNVWFAALGGDLVSFNGKQFKRYNEKQGLKHRFILSITEDKSGAIWLGCYGGGLYKFDGKRFINYSRKQGLKTESPYCLVTDATGKIWMGSNKGIEVLDPVTNEIKQYSKQDGFMGSECNPNAACMDSKGNLWFGTIMGALKFNPIQENKNNFSPLVHLTGLKINLQDSVFPSDHVFESKANNLSFSFMGISLSNPQKLRYEYTLEGYDKGWIPTDYTQHEATYTNLPAGDYKFKLRACNDQGIWSNPISYSFTVKPPFWQTAVFFVLMGGFIVFGVYAFDKFRTTKLKKSNTKLEQKVQERTLELAIRNAELAIKNKDISDSLYYAKRIQDNTFTATNQLKRIFPQSFYWNKPKEIMSGDFIWVAQSDQNIYVAVADCTGHGVPGAFLSIMANQLMERVWHAFNDPTPAQFLNELNRLAFTSFKNTNQGAKLQDGLDVCLCKISTKQPTIQFSGAHLSALLTEKSGYRHFKGDPYSIGLQPDFKFTNQEIQLTENSMLYLFSDGFEDQLSGKPKTEKQKYIEQLLLSIKELSITEQEQIIDENFCKLVAGEVQNDDATILGIRI